MARGRSFLPIIGRLAAGATLLTGALASTRAHASASPAVMAQNESPSNADLLFRAMKEDTHGSALSDNEKIDRALKEAAIEAHRKKMKMREAAKFWKDPFSADPDKLVPVQPAPRPENDLVSTKRELAKAKEEAAVARAEAAAAKAEAARANAARARAEANAAYQTAVAAKREAEAARASCQDMRLAKAAASPPKVAARPHDVAHEESSTLVAAGHQETSAPRKAKSKPAAKPENKPDSKQDSAPSRTLTQAEPAPPGTGGVGGEAGNAAAARAWRNGIVVVPLPPGRY